MTLRLDDIEKLNSPEGLDLLQQLRGKELTAADYLAVGSRLRERHAPDLVAAALSLTELRALGRAKFSRACQMWFTRAGLEQASSELVSRHIARRYEGCTRIADLCTGIGGNLIMLAQHAPVLAVDADPVHVKMAGLNAEVYGHTAVKLLTDNVQQVKLGHTDAVFIDPARREGQRRLTAGRSVPPLRWCLSLTDLAASVGVKVAPGIPGDLIPLDWEAEFISEDRKLRSAILWSPAMRTAARRATLLGLGLTLTPEPGPPVEIAPVGRYVIDPDPAVTRAGAVEDLARALQLWKIDEHIAFLSGDELVRTPFGRTLKVEASMPWSRKRLRAAVRAAGAGSVDIRKRGSAVNVDDLRQSLDLSGDRRLTIVLTRAAGRPWALICSDIDDAARPAL
jgi:THUMP domain-like/RNA cap guanine-N2 methyltransferase